MDTRSSEGEKIVRYRTICRGGEGEIVEKKSRFIASLLPISSEEEALAFLGERKKKYWDASHNCSAFVVGMRRELARCSDDGEPGGTAGRPMLEVLTGSGLTDVCAVVTRYFGGTLLGTGGLVRAYQAAVREGLAHCTVIEKRLAERLTLSCSYNDVGKVQYQMGVSGTTVLESVYTEEAVFTVLVPVEEKDRFVNLLNERCAGRIHLQEKGFTWFAQAAGETLLFDS